MSACVANGSGGSAPGDNIRVYCRVRGGGDAAKSVTTVAPGGRSIAVGGGAGGRGAAAGRQRSFDFSWVADGDARQEDVFEAAGRPLAAATTSAQSLKEWWLSSSSA